MDYCSHCRRHLNSALVCPGCGAYAPDIAPVVAGGNPWFDPRPRDKAALGAGVHGAGVHEAPDTAPYGDVESTVEGAPPAPQGRAARRRQKARWKKNQRRAVVATTVALIGGGLTFASMDRSANDKAQASTAPELPHTNGGAEEPTAELSLPQSPGTDARRSSPTPTNPPASNAPHEQSAAAPPHVSRQQTRPDTGTAPGTTAPSASKPKPSSPSSGGSGSGQSGTDTGAQTSTPTPTPTPSDSDDSNSNSGSNSGTTPASPAPEESSPDQLCLLVICLGG